MTTPRELTFIESGLAADVRRLEKERDELAKDVERLRARLTCMCGDDMDHSSNQGHMPVSMYDYALESMTKERNELVEGAALLLMAAEMEEHNYAIFSGRWKKGSKAWSGEFIAGKRKEGIAKVRALLSAHAPANEPDHPFSGSCGND